MAPLEILVVKTVDTMERAFDSYPAHLVKKIHARGQKTAYLRIRVKRGSVSRGITVQLIDSIKLLQS